MAISQSDGKSTIDTVEVNEFFRENFTRRALEYQDVFKKARKVFKEGEVVNTRHLNTKFYSRDFLAVDSTDADLISYRLFAGSNGIIGKDIILYVDRQSRVKELRIRDFGR